MRVFTFEDERDMIPMEPCVDLLEEIKNMSLRPTRILIHEQGSKVNLKYNGETLPNLYEFN